MSDEDDDATRRRLEIEPSAEDLALVGVEHGDLAGALAWLSPELRAVLHFTILDGLTTRETSPGPADHLRRRHQDLLKTSSP